MQHISVSQRFIPVDDAKRGPHESFPPPQLQLQPAQPKVSVSSSAATLGRLRRLWQAAVDVYVSHALGAVRVLRVLDSAATTRLCVVVRGGFSCSPFSSLAP